MWCLSKMLKPEASRRIGDKAIITLHAHQMAEALVAFCVAPTNPMGPEIRERGKLDRQVFENLVDVPRTGSADRATPQVASPKRNNEATTAITPYKRARVSPAGPSKVLSGDGV